MFRALFNATRTAVSRAFSLKRRHHRAKVERLTQARHAAGVVGALGLLDSPLAVGAAVVSVVAAVEATGGWPRKASEGTSPLTPLLYTGGAPIGGMADPR